MKTNTIIAHEWAHQTKKEGKGAFLFYEERVLYVYSKHFALGCVHHFGTIAFLTTRKQGVLTGRYKAIAKRAAKHLDIILCEHPEDTLMALHKEAHLRNINAYKLQYEAMPKRKSLTLKEQDLDFFIKNTSKYIGVFGLDNPEFLNKAKKEYESLIFSDQYQIENPHISIQQWKQLS